MLVFSDIYNQNIASTKQILDTITVYYRDSFITMVISKDFKHLSVHSLYFNAQWLQMKKPIIVKFKINQANESSPKEFKSML